MKLYEIMNENSQEWEVARKLLRNYEKRFIKIWRKNSELHYQNQELFWCGEELIKCILEEKTKDKEFKKIYKPYFDNYKKLEKEYNLLKILQKKGDKK